MPGGVTNEGVGTVEQGEVRVRSTGDLIPDSAREGDPVGKEGIVGSGETRNVGVGVGFQKGPGSEVIVALDAVGLYPSISKTLAMEVCKKAARETEIEVQHMNLLEATRLLVLTWPEEKIKNSVINKYLPRRRKVEGKKTGKLGITTSNSMKATPNDQTQWVWPRVEVPD